MLTKEDCVNAYIGTVFYHGKLRNSDGSPVRCRKNGAVKVWKTKPEEFRMPAKYGLRECFYITQENAHEWHTDEVDAVNAQSKEG